MNVICVGAEVLTLCLRNICIVLILGGGDDSYIAVLLCFLRSLLREHTGNDIVCLACAGEKIIANRCKYGGCSALKEENLIVIGNAHKSAEVSLCCLNDCFVIGRTVAHLHY